MKLSQPFLHLHHKWYGFINSVEGLLIANPHEYVKSCIDHCVEENRGNEVSLAYVQIFLSMNEIYLLVRADKKNFAIFICTRASVGRLKVYTASRNALRFTMKR